MAKQNDPFNDIPAPKSLELRLEVARVGLLFQQNAQGLIALIVLGGSYIFVSWGSRSKDFLIAWGLFVLISALCRVIMTVKWNRTAPTITTLEEVKPFLRLIHLLLFMSGVSWGVIASLMPSASTLEEQLVTCLVVIMMAAGGVVAYSSSRLAGLSVFLPAAIPWSISLWLSGHSMYRMMSVLLLLYSYVALRVSLNLHQFVVRSIRLNVENSLLTSESRANQERLELALEAAEAVTWKWQVGSEEIRWEGQLAPLFGLTQQTWVATLGEFGNFIHSEDRERVLAMIRNVSTEGEELDIEYRIPTEDGKETFVTQRGRVSKWPGSVLVSSGICWDITASKEQEKLQRELTEHEAASRAKSIFLANASHEIRTPLAAINGFADMALHNPKLPQDARQDVQMILRNGKYLVSLVNDLLDLSKIESGQIYIEPTRVWIAREIEDIVALVKPMIEAKNLDLRVIFRTKIPEHVQTDVTRFREVMINLITNSIKFTDKGKIKIEVTFEPTKAGDGIIKIIVSDTGIGISSQEMANLFKPFVRGSGERVQKVQGSGLGLSLSKNLARLLGGDLVLLRSKENDGSEFEFSFTTGSVDDVRMLSSAQATQARAEAYRLDSGKPLHGRSILVVDDSPDLQVLMKRFLEARGAKVEIRANGKEAVDRLNEKSYDLVLMDIKMPVMDGYTAADILRHNHYVGPLMAVTAHASAEDRQRCFQAGFDSYVSKPVDFQNLTEDVISLIERTNPRMVLH